MASSTDRGSRKAAAVKMPWKVDRRIKVAVKALSIPSWLGAGPNLHPRKVAQIVVRVGPPIRMTMFRVMVAIGKSSRFTEEYAAEMEGTPTALMPTPRIKSAQASMVMTSPWLAIYINKGQRARQRQRRSSGRYLAVVPTNG